MCFVCVNTVLCVLSLYLLCVGDCVTSLSERVSVCDCAKERRCVTIVAGACVIRLFQHADCGERGVDRGRARECDKTKRSR